VNGREFETQELISLKPGAKAAISYTIGTQITDFVIQDPTRSRDKRTPNLPRNSVIEFPSGKEVFLAPSEIRNRVIEFPSGKETLLPSQRGAHTIGEPAPPESRSPAAPSRDRAPTPPSTAVSPRQSAEASGGSSTMAAQRKSWVVTETTSIDVRRTQYNLTLTSRELLVESVIEATSGGTVTGRIKTEYRLLWSTLDLAAAAVFPADQGKANLRLQARSGERIRGRMTGHNYGQARDHGTDSTFLFLEFPSMEAARLALEELRTAAK
jgi:hypothetical protein